MTAIAGERRIVTVLFADIAGSSAIAERLGPERSKLLVDEVMRLMGAEVERYEGTVAQHAGDELYAVFGAPVAHEDDPERALRAALGIHRALDRYAADVVDAYGVELSVRVAVNTGPVVIRAASHDPLNALGDTANIAARIQRLVAGGEIVVGEETRAQVESCFELESLGEHTVHGLSRSVEAFRVVGMTREGRAIESAPLTGREFERAVLSRALSSLVDGHGVVIAITGEPGIGKSRLLDEVAADFADRVRIVEGRAASYAERFPYWPVRDLLRHWFDASEATPEARIRLELKTELRRLLGAAADDSYVFLAPLLGLPLEPEAAAAIGDVSREGVRRETFEVMRELIRRTAEEQALCLVFEDLHWADEATLDLIESLLPVTEEASVGLVLVYRSERDHASWRLAERARQRYPHRYRELELAPLPEDATRELVTVLAGAELPESVAALLVDRAGGNPLFLEEALRDLLERRELAREDGRLVLTVPADELAVPALVQATLQARFDRLTPATREVLGAASVIGRSVELPLLERVLPGENLPDALAELQRLGLLVEIRRRPAPEYRFRHGLVQEVAYASLLDTNRQRLHGRVGEALETLYPEPREDLYPLLAQHFAEADLPEKAADYLLRAGDSARALYANEEAIDHYTRAREFLARLGDDRRSRETLFKVALARHLAFDFPLAEAAYDEAFCCKVGPDSRLEPTETIDTAMERRPGPAIPGATYTIEGAQLTEHLFRGLLAVDHELNVVPSMADNFRVSADGLTYLFRIRADAVWSDGHPVTAGDFTYAWDRLREEQAATAFFLADVEESRALDDRTLEVRLREPRNYFPWILGSSWLFPRPRHACERLGDAWTEPESLVCNGPFTLARETDREIVLRANPRWAGSRGNIGEIRISFASTGRDLLDSWRAGHFDLLAGDDPAAAESPDTVTEIFPALRTYHICFRSNSAPFSSELVRRAFSHALDRERLTAAISPASRPALRGGAIPPAMPGHSNRIALEYDPELARRLLEDAGYPGGQGLPELEILVPSSVGDPTALLEAWQPVGARVRAVPVDVAGLCDPPPSAHMWFSGWTADYPDPDGFFRGYLETSGEEVYRDEQIETLLGRARSLRDQSERLRLYHEIDRLWVAERAAILPVCYGRTLLVRRPWVTGVSSSPMSGGSPRLDLAVVDRGASS